MMRKTPTGRITMEFFSHNEGETEALGARLAGLLQPGAVVALFGDLGMGKTAFTRGLARGLAVCDRVTSPTFTIVNEYEGRLPLFHFDLYRLNDAEELYEIGWEDYLGRRGICVVEWSERAEQLLTEESCIRVTLSRGDEPDTRNISIEGVPALEHSGS